MHYLILPVYQNQNVVGQKCMFNKQIWYFQIVLNVIQENHFRINKRTTSKFFLKIKLLFMSLIKTHHTTASEAGSDE